MEWVDEVENVVDILHALVLRLDLWTALDPEFCQVLANEIRLATGRRAAELVERVGQCIF